MNKRPELNKDTKSAAFRSFYYLKRELVDFCRENGLPASGSKAELTDTTQIHGEAAAYMSLVFHVFIV